MDYLDRFEKIFLNELEIYAPSLPVLASFNGKKSEMIFFYREENYLVVDVDKIAYLPIGEQNPIILSIFDVVPKAVLAMLLKEKNINQYLNDECEEAENVYIDEYEKIILANGVITIEQSKKLVKNLNMIIPSGGLKNLYCYLAKEFMEEIQTKAGMKL